MAQNITLLGASYSAVPAVQLPKTGGGTAYFVDTSDANATAADIDSGKTAYVNGVKLTGTGSGGGGTEVPENDVIYIDYDGTILYSYSKADFANLSAHPANPTHAGLTAQGWNWTLADAKETVAKIGQLVIGQMYSTSDGSTRLYITFPKNMQQVFWHAEVQYKQSVANGVTVDWGDGNTSTSEQAGSFYTALHDYSDPGDYVIKIKANSGTVTFGYGSNSYAIYGYVSTYTYRSLIRKIEFGSGTLFGSYACFAAYNLESVTLPQNATVSDSLFSNCTRLKGIVVPTGSTAINSGLVRNSGIRKISIPKEVTQIGSNAFTEAECLERVVIPDDVTDIGSTAFQYCYALSNVCCAPTSPPTLGSNAFRYCAKTRNQANASFYVPSNSLATYKAASNWSNYGSYMQGV